ncbi:MAG: TonB-dependent receptor [Gemmatimonadaceae bacterium]|nr:TonB-dependent receptor [Gemmatimonadaceae bacterium]
MLLTRVRRFVTTALLAVGIAPIAAAPVAAQSGTITGKITAVGTGAPIEGAQVQATSGSNRYSALSNAEGTYRLVNVADGAYTLVVRVIGYDTRTLTDVRPGSTTNITLTPRPIQLNETVVTASRARPEKALDAPASISVISSEKIEERPAITVTDHLRSTPGVDISRGGIAQSNVVARGFNNAFSGSMLMLQDYRFAGVPSLRVNVPFLFTGTNEDIDRMEVLLGPASALYGPNSSAGVLHVITKSPFNSQGTTISVDGGERSVIRTGLRHATKLNDKLAFKVSGEYMQGRDWEYNDRAEPKTFPSTNNVPASRRGQTNQRDFDLQRFSGEARVDVRPRENVEAITTLGYTNVGSGMELTGANGTAQIKGWTYTSLQQRLTWKRFFAQAFVNLSDAGNDTSSSDKGTYLLRSGQPIVDQSRVFAAQAQHGFDLGTKQSFTYGIDYIKTDPRTGGTINGGNEAVDNVTEYGYYLQSTTKPSKWFDVLLAARVDANNVIEGTFFSPRAALIFKPTENQNVRVTYNRAFSTPANFSFFLDLIQSPNIGGSGLDLVARGNPPKTGFAFNRTCTSNSAFGAYCMKSRFTGGGAFVGASAASAFPGLVAGNSTALTAAVAGALQQNGVPANFASQFATSAIQYLSSRSPSNTDITTRVSFLGSATPLTTAQVTDVVPLSASYNQTYELGYKGIVGDKFRFDVSLWGQERGDVATTAALATPTVQFTSAAQLAGYIGARLGENLGPNLSNLGLNAQQVGGLVQGISAALAGNLAPAPLGVVTFNDPNTSPTAIYATYSKVDKTLWVRGIDMAFDVVASDRLTFDAAVSWQNQNVWKDIIVGGIPFMANSPQSRGSVGARYRNENNGIGFELRTRYNEAYAVNSGVYSTNTAFNVAAGQPGAGTVAPGSTGFGKCTSPQTAGTFCYEDVPEAFTFDAQITKRFDIGAQKLMWSINAQNMFDNRVRTFPGAPEIGRMIMTRLQYSF